MGFGHERLDVYRTAIDYVGWGFCEELKGHRHAKDQLLRMIFPNKRVQATLASALGEIVSAWSRT